MATGGWIDALSYAAAPSAWVARGLIGLVAVAVLLRATRLGDRAPRMAVIVAGAVAAAAALPWLDPSRRVTLDALGVLGACAVGGGLMLWLERFVPSIALGVAAGATAMQLLAAAVAFGLVPASAGWSGLVVLLAVLGAVGAERWPNTSLSFVVSGPVVWALGYGEHPVLLLIAFLIGVALHDLVPLLRRERSKSYEVGS